MQISNTYKMTNLINEIKLTHGAPRVVILEGPSLKLRGEKGPPCGSN